MTRLTQAHYTRLLDELGEPYKVLPLQGDASALVTQRGGRVIGLFASPQDENLFWTSWAFDSAAAFHRFTHRDDGWGWNLGGDRVWIAPEITYNVRNRHDFSGTWHIPKAMDPGNYEIHHHGTDGLHLSQSMQLLAFDQGAQLGEASVRLSRTLRPTLRDPASGRADVQYFGYEADVTVELLNASPTAAEPWSLIQMNAGGTLILPVIGAVDASDYVGIPPEAARNPQQGIIYLPLNGTAQFKVAYQALCMTGRMGYWHQLTEDRAYLLVRTFFNDPGNLYAEEPPDQPGVTGHSVHIYNDDGQANNGRPFCEMECNGQTLSSTGTSQGMPHNRFSLWGYVGKPSAVRDICRAWFGGAP